MKQTFKGDILQNFRRGFYSCNEFQYNYMEGSGSATIHCFFVIFSNYTVGHVIPFNGSDASQNYFDIEPRHETTRAQINGVYT